MYVYIVMPLKLCLSYPRLYRLMNPVTWLSVLVLVGGVFLDAVNSSCRGGDVNGCNVYSWVPYKKFFEPACNRHDVCYGCGSKFGKSRGTCDREFKSNMMKMCTSGRCKRWANRYYTGVDWFGSDHYENQSPSWCNENWVTNCV